MSKYTFLGNAEYNKEGHYYLSIIIPKEIISQLGVQQRSRLKVEFPGGRYIHCALQYNKNHDFVIYLGKYFQEKAGVDPGREVKISISEDTSDLGMEMPQELEEVLSIDPEGVEGWAQLTPGKKRTAMYFVEKAKTEETKIKRALLIVDNIKMGFTGAYELIKRH
jgi:hypothetical protein